MQVAGLLLRHCGAGKFTHLLRSNPPTSVRAAARAYDTELLKAYEALASLDPLAEDQAEQCRLRLRDGGRGLRSQERLALQLRWAPGRSASLRCWCAPA